jgi:anaerobic magnesium-protoporphyrin IX monomethyl ester cyclase
MPKRVLLYNPPSEFYAMPLGLLAVGSAASAGGADVRIFDARIDREAEDRILAEADGAACVGMTVFSGSPIEFALRMSRKLKARFPDVPVVWGGWHASILPEQCVESGAVDAVCVSPVVTARPSARVPGSCRT